MKLDAIIQKINTINWSTIKVTVNWSDSTFGNAEEIAANLRDLFSGDTELAMKAAHELWCSLSHQHSYITSAAVPAYDFLMMGLSQLDDSLKVEILDILVGFAVCTSDAFYDVSKRKPLDWEIELKNKLTGDIQTFKDLSLHGDESISYFAGRVVSYLDNEPTVDVPLRRS